MNNDQESLWTWINSRYFPRSKIYELNPGEVFPLFYDLGEHYIPVPLSKALALKAYAENKAKELLSVVSSDNDSKKYEKISSILNEGEDRNAIIIFYSLGYSLQENFHVYASRIYTLESFLIFILNFREESYIQNTRILITSRCGAKTDPLALKISEAEAKRALAFTVNVIKPLAEAERILITEGLIALSGAEAVRLVVGLASWARALPIVIRGASLIKRISFLLYKVPGSSSINFILQMARPALQMLWNLMTKLAKTTLKIVDIVDNVDTAIKVLGELAKVYVHLKEVTNFVAASHEDGGLLVGTWKTSVSDDLEQKLLEDIIAAAKENGVFDYGD